MKTFCFKLYTNRKRNKEVHSQIDAAGLIYNHCIALHKRYYKLYGRHLDKNRLQKHLAKLKHQQKFSYIREINSQAVQDIADRIDKAYNLFFSGIKSKRKVSQPKFRKIKDYKSFTLKQSGYTLDEARGVIKLNKKFYKYFQSRKIEGEIKTLTVKRDALGDIYIYLVCDVQQEAITRTGKSVGYDFGLKRFLTASDGKDIEAPLFFGQNSKRIKSKNRNLSRKKANSHNRIRARLELARTHQKTTNQRKDFHFKTAKKLCEEYALICLEDLNIKAMQRLWGRKINDLGFCGFVQILKYQASKTGTQIIFVDRYFASSQKCSTCGYKNIEVKDLKVREWTCPICGVHHDRDRNAAANILMVGASTIGEEPVRHSSERRFVDTKIPCF